MRRSILVVDDDRSTLEMVSLLLEREGYKTFVSEDAMTALELARLSRPDLILLDVLMRPLDGWAFLDALLADPVLSSHQRGVREISRPHREDPQKTRLPA